MNMREGSTVLKRLKTQPLREGALHGG